MKKRICTKNASVLILSLWVLMLLTIFASAIGLKVRARMTLLSRLEDRSKIHYIAEAAVKFAISAIRSSVLSDPLGNMIDSKVYRFNNPEFFSMLKFDEGYSFVGYSANGHGESGKMHYGVIDEERKININVADRLILKNLIDLLGSKSEQETYVIVESIVDWREIGHSKLLGGPSDDYYYNLQHPYSKKNAPFELLEELKLVQGMDDELYRVLEPYIR